jgi:serine/threonine protein kinase
VSIETYGSYQLLKRLATGGMAQIYLARRQGPEASDRLLVVKRILPHLTENADFIKMFLDEARIAARLNHPNVVQVFDLGAQDDSFFIAMEYIHGEDLRKLLKRAEERGQPLPVPLVCRILVEACAALDYAHKRTDPATGRPLGIVHRDVSPQNILVTFEGGVKVVDFGIAKAADQATITRSGVLKGKYAYMSPEQAVGQRVDCRADIFALGVVLYEVLTGTRLFKRNTDFQTLTAVAECRVVPPSQVSPRVPADLDPIVLGALTKDPAERYQEAAQLQQALEAWLDAHRLPGSAEDLAAYMRELYADRLEAEARTGEVQVEDSEVSAPPPSPEPPPRRTGQRPAPSRTPSSPVEATAAQRPRAAARLGHAEPEPRPAQRLTGPRHEEEPPDELTSPIDPALLPVPLEPDEEQAVRTVGMRAPSRQARPDVTEPLAHEAPALSRQARPDVTEPLAHEARAVAREGALDAEELLEEEARDAAWEGALDAEEPLEEEARDAAWEGALDVTEPLPQQARSATRGLPHTGRMDDIEPPQAEQPAGYDVLVPAMPGGGRASSRVVLPVAPENEAEEDAPTRALRLSPAFRPATPAVRPAEVVPLTRPAEVVPLARPAEVVPLARPAAEPAKARRWQRVAGGGALVAVVGIVLLLAWPEPPPATVRLETLPPGATVVFEGQPLMERTPLVLPPVKAGRYSVVLSREGYEELRTTVEVPATGTVSPEPLRLVPLPPPPTDEAPGPGPFVRDSSQGAAGSARVRLRVETEPAEANVFFNREPQGPSPIEVMRPAGEEVAVRVEAAGYHPLLRVVKVGQGPEQVERFALLADSRLEGRTARVRFVIQRGAEVTCDGRRLGRAPFEPVELRVGNHECRFFHPDLKRTLIQRIEVRPDALNLVEVKLE